MRCDGISFDEQIVIDMSKDRPDTHIMVSCAVCTSKYKLNTGLIFKDDLQLTSRNDTHDKDINALKTQLSSVNEELTAAKLNLEIVITELKEVKNTIVNNDKTFKEKLKHLQNQPSTSSTSSHQGFPQDDSIKTIQDLIAMQGKSMKWMTESFKKVVNIVSNLDKKIDQKVPKNITEEVTLIRRNNVTGRSRNIAIASGQNHEELLKQIRNDSAFNELSIENIKKTP